jgi:hypothetical protein
MARQHIGPWNVSALQQRVEVGHYLGAVLGGVSRLAPPATCAVIADHVGDTPASQLLDEVLLLTKMNWNSARFAEQRPVTVRFAGQVGAILRDLPDDYTPEHRYAFYM